MKFSRRKDTQEAAPEAKRAEMSVAAQEVPQTPQVARRPISRAEFLRLVSAQAYQDVAEIAEAHGLNGNYGDWLSSRRSVAELAKMVKVSPRTAQYWTSRERVQS